MYSFERNSVGHYGVNSLLLIYPLYYGGIVNESHEGIMEVLSMNLIRRS